LSQSGPWRPAVVARLARTLGRMNRPLLPGAILILALTLSSASKAGGSFESVHVTSFVISNDVDYQLTVSPASSSKAGNLVDPYLGKCQTFTVHGTYSTVYSIFAFPSKVTRASHVSALAHLRQSFQSGTPVNLGWLGNGFVPLDPKNTCVVRSRALHLWHDREVTAVLSLHDAA
jgi:hypothetical protein